MGVKGMLLGLKSRYPTKIDTHNDTADNRRAKALETFPEALGPVLVSIELPEEISKGTQSQSTE